MTIKKIKAGNVEHDIEAASAQRLISENNNNEELYIADSNSTVGGVLSFGDMSIFEVGNFGYVSGGTSGKGIKLGGDRLEYAGSEIPTLFEMNTALSGKAASSHNHAASEITSGTLAAVRLPAATSSALGGVKVGSNITNSSGTISLTKANVTSALGYTPPTSDTNTTYTFATGDSNGQIKVTPSGGSAQNISVKGLGSAAYTASTAYATAAQGTLATNAMPKAGGTFTGALICNSSFTLKGGFELYGSTPYIDFHYGNSTGDYTSRIIEPSPGLLRINGVDFKDNGIRSNGSDITILGGNTSTTGASAHVNLCVTNSKYSNVGVVLASTEAAECNSFFRPITGGKVGLGSDTYRWYRMWTANSTNTSSDEREKSDIMSIADYPTTWSRDGSGNVFEKLFSKLIPKTYTLNIEPTDEIHMGFIAQDVANAFEELGLSEDDLGFISHNYWTDEETGEEKDRYGLAYEEFIALNTYMIQKQRDKIETLEERITQLEELVNSN